MIFYKLRTTFNSGKHKGKLLKEVLIEDQEYIDWCAINNEQFYISDSVIKEIKKTHPDFQLSREAIKCLRDKYEDWEIEQEFSHHFEDDDLYDDGDLDGFSSSEWDSDFDDDF